uniref:Protein kinase domain-containing protein n=1 Tax=Coccidioides posadasii RMSCC 3488 TaxID=454284 RepID=A0A0J6FIU9_COCPO|nr:hypothetical protein CPAG_05652 [Coccidioides posadasii RMSCC 3488]
MGTQGRHVALSPSRRNVHLVENQSMLEDFKKAEMEHQCPRKITDDKRVIYKSRSFGKPKNGEWGDPVLCDFREARIGQVQQRGPFVQTHIYRAPDIPFEVRWGFARGYIECRYTYLGPLPRKNICLITS